VARVQAAIVEGHDGSLWAVEIIAGAGVFAQADGESDYAEQLRTGDLSFGTYSLPAGTADTQSPHTEDEIYFIVSGRATFWTPALAVPVGPGSAVFVPADEPHRFTDITEDLTALVFFGPAEGSRA
jgi:mannose-6-phosphate isomerase-like protein (cupin superfamily)